MSCRRDSLAWANVSIAYKNEVEGQYFKMDSIGMYQQSVHLCSRLVHNIEAGWIYSDIKSIDAPGSCHPLPQMPLFHETAHIKSQGVRHGKDSPEA